MGANSFLIEMTPFQKGGKTILTKVACPESVLISLKYCFIVYVLFSLPCFLSLLLFFLGTFFFSEQFLVVA